MSAWLVWTIVLVPISVVGVWLAARHWYGWAISLLSEALWAAYALALHSVSLLIMSGIWACIHGRNTWRTYRDQHASANLRQLQDVGWDDVGWDSITGIRVMTSPHLPKGVMFLVNESAIPQLDQLKFGGKS